MYNGDRTKWLKLAYGMLALSLNHYSQQVHVQSGGGDRRGGQVVRRATPTMRCSSIRRSSTDNADSNFWGQPEDNITSYRQTQFMVNLMNGTQFGGVVDPRMTRMLSPSPDGAFRGLDPNVLGFGALTPRSSRTISTATRARAGRGAARAGTSSPTSRRCR